MKTYQAILRRKEPLAPGIFSLIIKLGEKVEVGAGNFFEFSTGATFLRRALSVSDEHEANLFFVLKEVGPGTSWLSSRKQGSTLNILGPLGNRARLPDQGPVMLLAGGIGAAPLLLLARKLRATGIQADALLAARTRDQLILASQFESLCRRVLLATDDGTKGLKGSLCDVLPPLIPGHDYQSFYACGPDVMFASLKALGLKKPVYAFLESRMGCGTGLCMGCAIRGSDGRFHRVCTEGPVFDLKDIVV